MNNKTELEKLKNKTDYIQKKSLKQMSSLGKN